MSMQRSTSAGGTALAGKYQEVGSGLYIPRRGPLVNRPSFAALKRAYLGFIESAPALTDTERRVGTLCACLADRPLYEATGLLVARIVPQVLASTLQIKRATTTLALFRLRSLGLVEIEHAPRAGRVLKHWRVLLIVAGGTP
jgi:hypothetical protein